MMGSVLCLSPDHSSFYVGYAFSGVVEKYLVSTGMLVCSALAHYGDVHSITVVQPDVLCTSGSDGQVRLLEMKSNSSPVETPTSKPTAALPHDELVYRQISTGVMSIGLARPPEHTLSQFKVMVCSCGAPQLIDLSGSLSVQSLTTVPNDIGKCSLCRVYDPVIIYDIIYLLPGQFTLSNVCYRRSLARIINIEPSSVHQTLYWIGKGRRGKCSDLSCNLKAN